MNGFNGLFRFSVFTKSLLNVSTITPAMFWNEETPITIAGLSATSSRGLCAPSPWRVCLLTGPDPTTRVLPAHWSCSVQWCSAHSPVPLRPMEFCPFAGPTPSSGVQSCAPALVLCFSSSFGPVLQPRSRFPFICHSVFNKACSQYYPSLHCVF